MKVLNGYWLLTWIGLLANLVAIPVVAIVVSSGPPLHIANISIAASLAWPASIVGIVACSGLIAKRNWGVILSIVALSMSLSGTLPYGVIRLIREKDVFGLSGFSLVIAIFNLLALIYWCRPGHRKVRL